MINLERTVRPAKKKINVGQGCEYKRANPHARLLFGPASRRDRAEREWRSVLQEGRTSQPAARAARST
jgi:hypothetical protein